MQRQWKFSIFFDSILGLAKMANKWCKRPNMCLPYNRLIGKTMDIIFFFDKMEKLFRSIDSCLINASPREYPKKLFWPMFQSWWNCPLSNIVSVETQAYLALALEAMRWAALTRSRLSRISMLLTLLNLSATQNTHNSTSAWLEQDLHACWYNKPSLI